MIWLIGSGLMAQDYAAVLKSLNLPFRVIGRGDSSASVFEQSCGLPVIRGGLENALADFPAPHYAIVATGVEQLSEVSQLLIKSGCRRLLLEKPGAIYLSEIESLKELSANKNDKVYISYNRRLYSSVFKLRKSVESDGGITSCI